MPRRHRIPEDQATRITIRVSLDEKREIDALAEAAGLTISDFLRRAALGDKDLEARIEEKVMRRVMAAMAAAS